MKVDKLTFALGLSLSNLKKKEKYSIATNVFKRNKIDTNILGTSVDWRAVYKILETTKKTKIEILSFLDINYPESLINIPDYPFILFYKGNLALLKKKNFISIVGSRLLSLYGLDIINTYIPQIAKKNIVTVSGLAMGIDQHVHDKTLEYGGATIAVLGSGIDIIYPKTSQKTFDLILESGGLILSEYPPGTKPLKYNFPLRNRIIAGLSPVTFVVEATQRSGSLITAKYATSYSRTVMTVPGNIFENNSVGTNNLIKYGSAIPVTSIEDILSEYNIESQKELFKINTSNLSETERLIIDIMKNETTNLNTLLTKTGCSVDKLILMMNRLRDQNIIDIDNFGRYKIKNYNY